ncbi:PREDICTED: zinc finger C2HC domain-containing protein 1A [Propithecus coquereli]|uniref:zinc finger C2HC domain-containing protein 1A n=1 Tax=Propithecus coquereli TaxID=379532 RepID=UPI00063F330B|nr:PREDICTED: zinc finger C2HC domain-containing protein 1A [Propithecus coquereli]
MEGLEENGSIVQVGELLPCKICGRTFFPVALKKHGPICQKTATKKRKTFDSSRQRAEGTDIPTVKPLKPRDQKWRHDTFQNKTLNASEHHYYRGLPRYEIASGVPSGKVSSVSSSLGNKLQTLSPSHKGIAAPQAGTNIKPRNSTPPSLARNPTTSSVLTSKRKTYTESYIARPDGDYASSLNGGNTKSIEGNSSGHLPKFCHECGTKYPVEWAKFCCECGIRRMIL